MKIGPSDGRRMKIGLCVRSIIDIAEGKVALVDVAAVVLGMRFLDFNHAIRTMRVSADVMSPGTAEYCISLMEELNRSGRLIFSYPIPNYYRSNMRNLNIPDIWVDIEPSLIEEGSEMIEPAWSSYLCAMLLSV